MSDQSHASRPSPDALLARIARSERGHAGRLKVFLGMAPGVGKTYSMLEAARLRAMSGEDVVVGVAETHGRTETAELLLGLEIVPRRRIEYRDTVIEEMDIDALVARRPALALVDELAHTNAPGSRHAKRWQDVDDLLAAGIDVYTTVNIQHLESLNDAVAQITGVRVRETIPDGVLERADEVELVDLPVDELIDRLRAGRVYVPEQAERAIAKYFREGNLNALRQLALRFVASRVDREMSTYMQAHAIPGPWPTNERLMVSVGPSPLSPRLVRATRRMAERRAAEWIAVYVETPSHYRLPEEDRARVAQTLRLAEDLGGRVVTIPGSNVADELLRFAQAENVTEIVVGRSLRSWWVELVRGSIVPRLVRNTSNIDIYVVSTDEEVPGARGGSQIHSDARHPARVRQILVALTLVAAATGAAALLRHSISVPNLSLVFLVAVLLTAVQGELRVAIAVSILSVLVYDFFFVPPHFTFTITSPQDVLALVVFLIVAILTSNLVGRIRNQSAAARVREARTAALYSLSRQVVGELGASEIAGSVAAEVARHFDSCAVILVREGERLTPAASSDPDVALGDSSLAAATWCFRHERMAGNGTDTLPGDPWLHVPLRAGGNVVGVLALRSEGDTRFTEPDQRRFVEAFADVAAVALERARLVSEIEQAAHLAERERIQSLLLSSISHDLRTPLASIIGSATSLLEGRDQYDVATRTELASTILEEGERLDRFVGNLLETTRIEAGALQLNRDWSDVSDIVGTAMRSMSSKLAGYHVAIDIPVLPLIYVDFVLIEQVVLNLLDNAVKYSGKELTIAIEARVDGQTLCLSVTDNGPGIPPEDIEHVFDRFYRATKRDKAVAGTGLGLSICRGIMLEHGGAITAESPAADGHGTRMTLSFPLTEQRQLDVLTEADA
jgi:two-component system sensor histidine kinase KdpD